MKFFVLFTTALTVASFGFNLTTTAVKSLAPGVSLTQEVSAYPPLLVNTLTVDGKAPGVIVAPAVANDSLTNNTGDIRKGRENVSSLVKRTGVLAAINGDYFPYTGDPLGLGIMNGEIYSEPYSAVSSLGRAAIGWLPGGKAVVGIVGLRGSITASDQFEMSISGIDRMTALNTPTDVVVYTPRYGPTSGSRSGGWEMAVNNVNLPLSPGKEMTGVVQDIVGGSANLTPEPIPPSGVVVSIPAGSTHTTDLREHFHPGDTVSFICNLTDITPNKAGLRSNDPDVWNSVKQAIGGGPILIKDGQIIVDDVAEGLGSLFSTAPHARTSVGVKADGTMMLVTVDSGSSLSGGISLQDMAALMQRKGAINSINLDGGGSTTMVADGMTVDYPYGQNTERPVADMLTVSAQTKIIISDPPMIALPQAMMGVGQNYPLGITVGADVLAGGQQDVIWNGPAGAIGFVTQDGILHVLKSGHGMITASVHGQQASVDVDVPPTLAPNQVQPTAPITAAPNSTP